MRSRYAEHIFKEASATKGTSHVVAEPFRDMSGQKEDTCPSEASPFGGQSTARSIKPHHMIELEVNYASEPLASTMVIEELTKVKLGIA